MLELVEVEYEFDGETLPVAMAHLCEHILCANLHILGAARIKATTNENSMIVSWIQSHADNDLSFAMWHHDISAQLVEQESLIIETELEWISPKFKLYDSPSDLESWWNLCYRSLRLKRTRQKEIGESFALKAIKKHSSKYCNGIRNCFDEANSVPIGVFLANKQISFDYLCQIDAPGYKIPNLYWRLEALSDYSSPLTQILRRNSKGIYGSRIGLFPYLGQWYLFVSGLHKLSSCQFLKNVASAVDHICSADYSEQNKKQLQLASFGAFNEFCFNSFSIAKIFNNLTENRSVEKACNAPNNLHQEIIQAATFVKRELENVNDISH